MSSQVPYIFAAENQKYNDIKMEYKSYKIYGNVIVAQSIDYQWGVLDLEGNVIVPFGKYGWIDGFENGLARVRTHGDSGRVGNTKAILDFTSENTQVIEGKNDLEAYIKSDRAKNPSKYAKWGIINENGEEVLPVEYDDVWNFLGKGRYSTKVVKDNNVKEVYFHDLNPNLPIRDTRYSNMYKNQRRYDSYGSHYGEYEGSYAQDVMGYSDDVINDAFDGDPDAYWNID